MKNKIYVKVPKEAISLLTRIIEGFDNLGVVSTVCSEQGLAVIRVTPDTVDDILRILASLSFVKQIGEAD